MEKNDGREVGDGHEGSTGMKKSPMQNTPKRVSKPLMEKRRRERINSSLETLRVLMVEVTDNEKLKNPKVEKAEILESVVQYLKTEKQPDRASNPPGRGLSRESMSSCAQQQSFHSGVRSCMMRVNQFMAHSSGESKENRALQAPLAQPSMSPPAMAHGSVRGAHGAVAMGLVPPHIGHHQGQVEAPKPFVGGSYYRRDNVLPPAVLMQVNDSVWRPWPK